MVTKRDNFELDFSLDPVYEYRDPRGFRGSRVFQPSSSRVPLYGPPVAAPAAGLSTPLLLAAVAITIFVLGAVIGIPLAVIFGIVLPNSSTVETPTGSSTTQPPVPQVPDPVIPNTVAPPPRTLLVRCPDDINTNTQQGEAYAIVTWDPPMVLSETEGQVQMMSTVQPNTRFPVGFQRVQYTVTDTASNTGSCSFQVTVVDNEPPSIQCPANRTVPTDPLSISARVFWDPPTITENAGIVTVRQQTDQSGDQFHVGPHVVTIVIHDEANNENRCSFSIVVEDREKPRVTCPAGIVAFTNDPLVGMARATWSAPLVRDNSLGQLVAICTPASGSAFPFGNTPVNCMATDAAGNPGSCMFMVMIRFNDTLPPEFVSCPSDIVVNATQDSASAFVTWIPPNATDNSLQIPTINANTQPDRQYEIGSYQVIYTAMDVEGNSAQCSFQVEVLDSQDPSIMCPDDLIRNTDRGRPDATVILPAPTTSDNSVTSLTVTTNPPGSPVLRIGNHTVTYTVADDSGNTASCDVTVMIRDGEKPTFTRPANTSLPAGPGVSFAIAVLPLPTNLMDNSGEIVRVSTTPANNTMLPIGENIIVYTVSDAFGLSVSFSIQVIVLDNENPSIMCPDDLIQNTDSGRANATVTLPAAPGLCLQMRDIELPSFTRPSNFSLPTVSGESFAIVRLPLLTDVTDNSGQDVNVTTSVPDNSQLPIGIHAIVYTVTDVSGNVVTFTITVTVVDEEAPRFTPPSNFTIPAIGGESFAIVRLPLPTNVADNSGDAVNITTSPANNSMLDIGPHSIVYTLTDSMGRFSMFTIIVTVEDKEDPSIMCPDDIIQDNDRGQGYATITVPDPATVSVSDNSEGQLTTRAELNGTHQFRIGNHTIMYNVTDESGNSMSCTLNITVNDVENPTFTRPVNTSFSAGLGVSFAIAVLPLPTNLMDNSGEVVRVSTTPANNTMLPIGEHIIVYTVSDAFGLSVSFSIQVIVL
ncbi:hyalin-like, partial [Acanthaster planci]|uniref:Hyalin-like n=1 Tax=Acanthaster planci TaxID=133434 RepID=A0A8B7ZR59_ACAPL